MKRGLLSRVIGAFTAAALLSCSLTAAVSAKTVTERTLLAYDAATTTKSGTLFTALNRGSTLNTYQYSKNGYYFNTSKTAAVTNNLIEPETERYRIFPEGDSNSNSRSVFYEELIDKFDEKYISLDFTALGGYGWVTEEPKIGLSAVSTAASDANTPKI